MKGIQINKFGGPEVLEITELDPPIPGKSEVLVTLHAAGVNPVETYVRQGGYGESDPDLPYVPGSDGAGIIEKVGEGVTHLKAGDRVFVSASTAEKQTGSYAEKMVCDSQCVYPLPDSLSFHQGAALGVPALAAYRSLFLKADIKPAESVLIHGASGGVGLLAVQMAKYAGAVVIGTAGSKAGENIVKEHGADFVLNHRESGYLEAIPSLLGIDGVDVVIEMLANVNLGKDLKHIKQGGRVVVVGSKGSLDFKPRLIMAKEAHVIGMSIAHTTDTELKEMMHGLLPMLQSGFLNPYVGKVFPLEEAASAHEEVTNGDSNGMVVLDMKK